MLQLQQLLPIFFNLINSVGELPEASFKPLILHLKSVANEPFEKSSFVEETQYDDDHNLSL